MIINIPNPLDLFKKKPAEQKPAASLQNSVPSPAIGTAANAAALTPEPPSKTLEVPAKAEENAMPAETIIAKVEGEIITVMEKIGKDAKIVLADVVKYEPGAASLAAVIFPQSAPVAATVTTAVGLIQNAVTVVEQKYAASGVSTGTGAQKLAEVLTLTEQAVTALLAQAGIKADTAYVTNIVNAVVAILNVQTAA